MSEFNINEVMEYLPHRYPFLLVDKVLECSAGDYLSALKNVTINEPFFQGHFPGQPIMPGVLIIEALAQATGLLSYYSMTEQDPKSKLYILVGIDKARFRGQVIPGDQLILNIKLKRNMRGILMYQAQALVEGKVVTDAEIMCTSQDRK